MIYAEFLLIRIFIHQVILKFNKEVEIVYYNSKMISSVMYHLILTFLRERNYVINNN